MNKSYNVNGVLSKEDQYKFQKKSICDPNTPSPYIEPQYNYGYGPQIYDIMHSVDDAPNKGVFSKEPVLREPTVNNPMMNVSPLDYGMKPFFSDYNRYETGAYTDKNKLEVRELVHKNFDNGLFQDADSMLWNRLNSQRQFFSAPVGSVPSDQSEFGNWLYGNKYVCKQGSVYQGYGVKYTDDSLTCNGTNASVPTNKGLMGGKLSSSVEGGSRG